MLHLETYLAYLVTLPMLLLLPPFLYVVVCLHFSICLPIFLHCWLLLIKNPNIKHALYHRPQKYLVWITAQASSPQTAEFGVEDLPLSGSKGDQQRHHNRLSATMQQITVYCGI